MQTAWVATSVGGWTCFIALAVLRGALVAVGIVLPLLVLARYRSLLRLEASAPVPEPEYTLLPRVGMFAPLPVVRIEELARRVEHVRAGVGDAIIREGESGDRFYVIADGAVEVTERAGSAASRRSVTASVRSRSCAPPRAPRRSSPAPTSTCSRSSGTSSWPRSPAIAAPWRRATSSPTLV